MKKILLLSAACFVFSPSVFADTHVSDEAHHEVPSAEAVAVEAEKVVEVEDAAPAHAHWGYGPKDGAHKWGMLDEAYHACKDGKAQSPINIDKFLQEDLADIVPSYNDMPLVVENNGHTVQVNAAEGSGFRVGDTVYDLLQLHFHTPSEHYLDGAPYPMEVHFVHKAKDGGFGVIGVMMKVGAHNPVIEGIWQNVPAAGETKTVVNVSMNAGMLMPESREYYSYMGSLTTPPCTEGIAWHVMKDPIELSQEQLVAFQSVFPVNARPVQPLNDRVVTGD